jgi:YcaO-like protein with predicted kinase domain
MNAADVIEHYEAVLSSFGEVVDFDISDLDRLDIPVTSCSLIAGDRFAAQANGYGTTLEAARIGGLGELAEGVLLGRAVSELLRASVRGSRRDLVNAQGEDRVVDPRMLGLPAWSPFDDEWPLVWVPTKRVRTGETVYVPADFVVSEPGELDTEQALITPVTNGLGAGLDEARAISHGILEILQRHTNGLRFRALDRLSPQIEETELPPAVRELAARMQQLGVSPVFKHAATEFGVCSTYVMGLDDDPSEPIQLTACGEAAHPSAEVSLTKALLEYANSRARKAFFFGRQAHARRLGPPAYWEALRSRDENLNEQRAREAMQLWADLDIEKLRSLTMPRRDRTVSYADIALPALRDLCPQDELLSYLLDALDGREPAHDVLAVTTSVGGVTAAKVMITNVEVETLSYGRIGELGVRMSLDSDLGLVRMANGPTHTHPARVALTPAAEERLGGLVYYSYEVADRIVGDLYPLYREPLRHSVTV